MAALASPVATPSTIRARSASRPGLVCAGQPNQLPVLVVGEGDRDRGRDHRDLVCPAPPGPLPADTPQGATMTPMAKPGSTDG